MSNNKIELLKRVDNKLERVKLSEVRDAVYEKFRTNCRVLRAWRGLSGCEASDGIGLKNGKRIIDLEYGRANPSIEEIMAIARYFGASMDDLLYGEAFISFQKP